MTRVPSPPSGFDPALWGATAVWLVAVVWASRSGALSALGLRLMPGFALIVALGIGIPVGLYFALPVARRAVDAIGLHRLIPMHVWRLPASLVLLRTLAKARRS